LAQDGTALTGFNFASPTSVQGDALQLGFGEAYCRRMPTLRFHLAGRLECELHPEHPRSVAEFVVGQHGKLDGPRRHPNHEPAHVYGKWDRRPSRIQPFGLLQDQLVEIPHSELGRRPEPQACLCGAVWPRPRQLSHLVASDPGLPDQRHSPRADFRSPVAKISLLVGNARKLAQGIQSPLAAAYACAQIRENRQLFQVLPVPSPRGQDHKRPKNPGRAFRRQVLR